MIEAVNVPPSRRTGRGHRLETTCKVHLVENDMKDSGSRRMFRVCDFDSKLQYKVTEFKINTAKTPAEQGQGPGPGATVAN